jgi:hypothetical protein
MINNQNNYPPIEGGNNEINAVLHSTVDFVRANGGFIHPSLRIRMDNGNFSVYTLPGSISPSELMVHLPDACLPSLVDFTVNLSEDKLCIETTNPAVTAAMKQGLELVFALYNLTSKIKTHTNNSIYLYLYENNRTLFDFINTAHLPLDIPSEDRNSRILKSFFSSRTMAYTAGNGQRRIYILMPFLDLLNHSNQAMPAGALPLPEHLAAGISVFYSSSPNNDECLYRYSFFDPLSCGFFGGFVDPSQNIARSIPLTLSLDSIKLFISRRKELSAPEAIPDVAKDLALYFPVFAIDEENGLPALSQLVIPSAIAPRSMRRILELAIRNIRPDI